MTRWEACGRAIVTGRVPRVMGIVNVTPDSFSDGGRAATRDAAIAHALRLVDEGADLLDIGGESSRPGAEPVPEDEELRRVLPVVEALAPRVPVPISVDTTKARVAARRSAPVRSSSTTSQRWAAIGTCPASSPSRARGSC